MTSTQMNHIFICPSPTQENPYPRNNLYVQNYSSIPYNVHLQHAHNIEQAYILNYHACGHP